ncbi:MAG: DNA-binding protein [Chitinispirillaceae bacterium]|nr:DNA-binding protein [Chitinispirillaceae bacterium]
MNCAQATMGRIFIVRLTHGEILHECIERFALEKAIRLATVIALGGADKGSRVVAGPRDGAARPIEPMEHLLDNVHEIAGVGTIAPNASGSPVLHLHAAVGRGDTAICGCVRGGVITWHVLEIVIFELVNTTTKRTFESESGFELLQP